MSEVASLTVVAHGVATDQLLFCLRASLSSFNVEVGDLNGDRVCVVALGSNLDNLRHLVDQRLDQCAERLNVLERRDLLLVEMSDADAVGEERG